MKPLSKGYRKPEVARLEQGIPCWLFILGGREGGRGGRREGGREGGGREGGNRDGEGTMEEQKEVKHHTRVTELPTHVLNVFPGTVIFRPTRTLIILLKTS